VQAIEREIVYNFVRCVFAKKEGAEATFVFGQLEGLLARDLIGGSITKSDLFRDLTDVNRHGSVDIIQKLKKFTDDIEKAVSHTLKPMYEELYANHDDRASKVSA